VYLVNYKVFNYQLTWSMWWGLPVGLPDIGWWIPIGPCGCQHNIQYIINIIMW